MYGIHQLVSLIPLKQVDQFLIRRRLITLLIPLLTTPFSPDTQLAYVEVHILDYCLER
jgi:hypothetical protein